MTTACKHQSEPLQFPCMECESEWCDGTNPDCDSYTEWIDQEGG